MYSELERKAYMQGDTNLAEVYDRLYELQEREDTEDERLASEYKRGLEDGRFQDDKFALEEAELKLESFKGANKALYEEFLNFLQWLKSDEARLAKDRKAKIAHLERTLHRFRKF